MFEVGFTEIVLILGIALVVLGPEKLPKIANQVGRWAGRARAMARQLRSQLDEEVASVERPWQAPEAPRPGPDTPPPYDPVPDEPGSHRDTVDPDAEADAADGGGAAPRRDA